MKKVYYAGGWFSPEQEEEHTRVYNTIKDSFDVFNPKLAGIIDDTYTADKSVNILLGNLKAINDADIIVAITDRKDMGTIWEAGYAFGRKKPVIYYAETLGDNPFNVMLAKTGLVARNEKELLELLNDEKSYETHEYFNQYQGRIC